jgi:hypothetical protein
MDRLVWVTLALAILGCRSPAPAAPRELAAPTVPSARADASAIPAQTRAGLLAEIGRRFGPGLSPAELARSAGAPAPVLVGKSWTIDIPKLGLQLSVDAAAVSGPASWIRAHVMPGVMIPLSEVAGVFGAYRKLPPGEYTWVMFEKFRPAEVTVSASALTGGDESSWRVARIQFQHPPHR